MNADEERPSVTSATWLGEFSCALADPLTSPVDGSTVEVTVAVPPVRARVSTFPATALAVGVRTEGVWNPRRISSSEPSVSARPGISADTRLSNARRAAVTPTSVLVAAIAVGGAGTLHGRIPTPARLFHPAIGDCPRSSTSARTVAIAVDASAARLADGGMCNTDVSEVAARCMAADALTLAPVAATTTEPGLPTETGSTRPPR